MSVSILSMTRLEALIFDVDGTLAETEELHRQAFNTAFAIEDIGLYWDQGEYRERLRVAGGKERIAQALMARPGQEHGDRMALIQRVHARKTHLYTGAIAAGRLPLRAGVDRLVCEAHRAGLRLAIASTTTRANVEALLASAWPAGHPFEVLSCADTAPNKKPAPDVYLATLDALGLPADRVLAIEDSSNGVRAARAAGLPVLATPSLYCCTNDFGGATAIVAGLGEPDAPEAAIDAPIPFGGWVDVAWLRALAGHAASRLAGDFGWQTGVGVAAAAGGTQGRPAADRIGTWAVAGTGARTCWETMGCSSRTAPL